MAVLSEEEWREINLHHLVRTVSLSDPFLTYRLTHIILIFKILQQLQISFTEKAMSLKQSKNPIQSALALQWHLWPVSYHCPSPHLLWSSHMAPFLFVYQTIPEVMHLHTNSFAWNILSPNSHMAYPQLLLNLCWKIRFSELSSLSTYAVTTTPSLSASHHSYHSQ